MTTWGAESDYKHFLPRICELIAFADPGSGLHERTNWKLDMVRSYEWSEVEEQATHGYFVALWDYTLLKLPQDISDEPVSDIVDCLNSLVILGFDLPELLDLWLERAESSLAPALRIAELAISTHSLTVTTAQREQIASWLLGDRVRSLLDRHRVQSAEVNEEYADYISYSMAQLDKWRDERPQEGHHSGVVT
ncbi:MAG: hypothetical protein M3328_07845 [Chloroflexota bacterium]|nr:hypothetical protein [Chloroflexota bacterium]